MISKGIGIAAGLVFAIATLVGSPALAEELDGAALFAAKTCIACHGAEGRTPILPMYPKLVGQNWEYMVNQVTDIKSGARNNGQTAAMQGVLHLVNEEEIKAITLYLSKLTP